MDKQILFETINNNLRILNGIAEYLNNDPRAITARKVKNLSKACQISEDEAYIAYFSAICGLNTEKKEDLNLERNYIRTGLQKLDISTFLQNPYYKNIHFPSIKKDSWEMKTEQYFPYQPFAAGHPIYTKDFLEIPRVGYFDKIFSFPAILENGIEWMTITPNEIITMEEPIQNAKGKVITLGLGLGYYAYMVSSKKEVDKLVIVERDTRVISLFQEYILPQFPNKDKIEIISSDAFAYLKSHLANEKPDVLFADLWHDPSDGIDLYTKLLTFEALSPNTHYDYWIEPSILYTIRHIYFENISKKNSLPIKAEDLEKIMDNSYLKSVVRTINLT